MSDNPQSGGKEGLLARIGQFFLRQRLHQAARSSHGYKREAIDLLKSHPDVASDVLVRDLGDKSQDSTYRMYIPRLLGTIGGKKAQDACLQLLHDTTDAGPVRRMAVNAVAEMGLAAESPFFEALLSCVHETTGFVEHDSAKALCQTGRREVIPHVGAYLVACPAILRNDVEKALESMGADWTASDEATELVPALIEAYRDGDVERRQFAVQYMGKLAAAQCADLLREALAERQGLVSHYAEQALRVVAQKHNLQKHLDHLAGVDKQREEERRGGEERKRAEEERRAKETSELRHRIHAGMSLAEVEKLLGPPSSHLGGGALLGMFGSVSGSASAISSVSQRQFYVWRRPEGEWKLVFVGDKLTDVYSAP